MFKWNYGFGQSLYRTKAFSDFCVMKYSITIQAELKLPEVQSLLRLIA